MTVLDTSPSSDAAAARPRCPWSPASGIYADYHDHEWGRPVGDDVRLFEKLCLEGFQSGLSWLTILNKRENFRRAFFGWEPERVAAMGEADVQRLLGDVGIIRHRGKIAAAINNAARLLEVRAEFGPFAAFIWSFEPPAEERPETITAATLRAMAETPASRRLSAALRKRGFKFVGPTTAYAFMQAMGLVNDHLDSCGCRAEVEAERAAFTRPAASPQR